METYRRDINIKVKNGIDFEGKIKANFRIKSLSPEVILFLEGFDNFIDFVKIEKENSEVKIEEGDYESNR